MARYLLAIALLLTATMAPPSRAAGDEKEQGTTFAELAARHLPAPSQLSVAVLPFSISSASSLPGPQLRRQAEMPRACVLLNLQRHGFKIMPEAKSLALVPASTDKAVGLDWASGMPPEWDRERAVEAGKSTGADWVMYGDLALQLDYRTQLLKPKKIVRISVRLVVVDVGSGQVVFWKRVEESTQGSSTAHGFQANAEDSEIARGLLLRATGDLLDTISKALPKHAVGTAVTPKQLEDVVGAMGL